MADASIKFGRHYKLTVQLTDATAIEITDPITINFNVHRSVAASVNGMTLQIYNLSETHRNLIFQDRYQVRRFRMILQAGYASLSTIFVGDIFEANSARQGADMITTIDARDGFFDANQTIVSTTLPPGSTRKDLIAYLGKQFPQLKLGRIGDSFGGKFTRGITLEGNLYEQIKKYTDNNVYIDLETINMLGQNEVVINNDLPLIDDSTGLLDTPRRDGGYLSVRTIFEPRVQVGQIISMKSSINKTYNGIYKVLGITHQGTISGAVGGECVTTFALNNNQSAGQLITV